MVHFAISSTKVNMFIKIILFVCLCTLVKSREPECSRFHYEEKTLEKMIKTEIYVDKIKADTDAVHQEMTVEFDGFRKDIENTKREVSEAKEQTTKVVNEVKERLDEILSPQAVAFQAHNLAKTDLNDGETLVFSTTTFDIGSGYNNSTGVFAAPVAGIYILTLQLCINSKRYFDFEIASDNVSILKGCFHDDNSGLVGCQSTSVVALLGVKQNVWIKTVTTSSGSEFWKESKVWNSFSGVLVSAISN